ncbi:hypothetical protein HQ46_03635 [Porphyromonas gulae]|uniref:Uncharacterized protein n=1 Tax=Porphyromonas gulae TaxID=111105 RepID=A0A0A2F6M7_9PORP|nr:hypothetical protein HR15_07705 [Porphyromonas gulae]KGN89802.1 hypothetical protein HQ46_03635 [Porphyromonas gulae]KKC51426.1 hypothetical protein HR10_03700 [Porphyromonas gulae]
MTTATPFNCSKATPQTILVTKMRLFVGKSAFRLCNADCSACKHANRTRNSLPQLAGKHFRAQKASRNLRDDKIAPKLLPASCGEQFPVKDAFPQVEATFFGTAMQIPRRTFPFR